MNIYSPPGNLIGVVFERCTIVYPSLHLFDAMLPDTPLYEVNGPLITCSCFGSDVDFPIFEYGKSQESEPVGTITKTWGGVMKELFTDADTFGVNFPVNLEPKHKVIFLATCLLIVSIILNTIGLTGSFTENRITNFLNEEHKSGAQRGKGAI